MYIEAHRKPVKQMKSQENQEAYMYDEELQEPILGKNVILPPTEPFQAIPQLDKGLRYVIETIFYSKNLNFKNYFFFFQCPVYKHLEYHKAEPIDMPKTPRLLTKCKNLNFLAQHHSENDSRSN